MKNLTKPNHSELLVANAPKHSEVKGGRISAFLNKAGSIIERLMELSFRRQVQPSLIPVKKMKSFFMLIASLVLLSSVANAQFTSIPVTGFNNDIVASGVGPGTLLSMPGVSNPTIGVDGAGFTFIDNTYKWQAANAFPTCNMPSTGTAPSLVTAGLTYTFQSYNANNALTLDNNSSTYLTSPFPNNGTLTLTTPASYTKLYVLYESVNNIGPSFLVDATVTFTDATTQVFPANTCVNWFSGTPAVTNIARAQNVSPGTGSTCPVAPNLFELPLVISGSNYGKQVASISFSIPGTFNTGTQAVHVNYFHAMAVGGMSACLAPTAQPTLPTLTTISNNQIDGSFTAAAGSPSGYLVVRYPASASETFPVDGVTYVAGQSLGLGTVVQSGATTTFTNTGLLGSTSYDYYVYSYNTGVTCGGPIYLTTSGSIGNASTTTCAGLAAGTYSVGPTGTYPSLTAAMVDVNAGVTGSVILELQSTYVSTVETFPIAFPANACLSPSKTLTIRPESGATGISITSNNTTGTINFNGGNYITIDGRAGGTGISQLTIANTNAGVSYAMNFTGDASNNTIQYCTITSRNNSATSGSIVFGAGSVTGNDNNTIDNCNITDDASATFPVNGIYSSGTSAAIDNSGNIVTNCNVSNYYSATLSSAGIFLSTTGNSTWNISNNRFFQTATRLYTAALASLSAITVGTGSGYTITGNIIGFNSAAGTAGTYTSMIGNSVTLAGFPTAYVVSGTATATRYIAINCAFTAAGAISNIQGNTIAGLALYTSSGATSANGILCGINVTSGNVNIGTTAGNTIGSTTGLGSIYTACTTSGGAVVGIFVSSANTVAIQNNTIGAIDASGSSATTNGGVYGIDVTGAGNFLISNNIIGNATAGNIRTGFIQTGANLAAGGTTLTSTTGASSLMLGVRSAITGSSININNITCRNWTTSGTTTALQGIISSGAMTGSVLSASINNNFLGTSNTGAGAWMTYTVANTGTITGISLTNTIALNSSVQTNDIRGIVYTATSASQAINFIIATGGTAAGNVTTVSGNTFTNLNVNTTGTITFISMTYTGAASCTKIVANNSIVTSFVRAATAASGSILLVTDNGSTAAGALSYCQNNNFSNITVSGTATITGLNYTDGGGPPTKNFTGNILNNWSAGTGTVNCINITYLNGASLLSNNTITNILGQGAITGITIGSTVNLANPFTLSNNTINNLISSGTGGAVIGISCVNTSPLININNNTINTLSTTAGAAVTGISIGGATNTSLFKNKIYDLSGSNASSSVNGILVSAGTLINVSNNTIGDLRTPSANAANALVGMNFTGGTTINAYYNTVRLANTGGGSLFGSSALSASTTPNLTLRNNILVNTSAFVGSGLTVAYRRSTTTLTTYNAASNNNIFYAGTPGANNLIYTDGTNSDQSALTFKVRVAPMDAFSGSENPPFLSTLGSSSDFLHIDPAVATNAESGAVNITGITDDFDSQTRQGNVGYVGTGTAPDIGADEFSGTVAIALAAPINFGSNTPTTSSFNITWDDNSVGETGFLVYRSLNPGGPFNVIVASVTSTSSATTGTGYSLPQTGLLGNTTYYYQIVANNFANSAPLSGNASTTACGSGLAGTFLIPGAYPHITAALQALQTNGLSGPVILELDPTYTSALEVGSFPLTISNAIGCLNATNTLTLRPAATVVAPLTLTSASGVATIDINGGNYVTIDGRPGGVGTSKFLVVENTSTIAVVAGNAILIRNEATNNTITYCDVRSANANPATNTVVTTLGSIPGAIALGTTAGIFGNDKNTISFCDIHSTATNTLCVGIYAGNATAVGSSANNDSTLISDCNIYDYFSATLATAAINIALGNNSSSITNNSVYQTATRTYTGTQTVRGFWITPASGSTAFASGNTISGNYIGGSAPLCGGTASTLTGTTAWFYSAMDVSVGTGTATSIQGNTVTNIAMTSATATALSFVGITVTNGTTNIGNVIGNTIGSPLLNSAPYGITFTTTTTLGGLLGIRVAGTGPHNISNNTIAGIELIGNATTIAPSFNGINYAGGTLCTINNNTIGSSTLANSINLSSTSATSTSANACRGIVSNTSSVNSIITNNLIANINSNYSGTGSGNKIVGIELGVGFGTISTNIIRNITSASTSAGSGVSSAIQGIALNTSTAGDTVVSNQIYSLKLTTASATTGTQITGIFWAPSLVTANNLLARNFIHSFDVAYTTTSSTAATLTGIDVSTGLSTIQNNMIRLGINDAGASITTPLVIRGIQVGTTSATNIYFNSVYIGGSGVLNASSVANHSAAFNRSATSGALVLRNNVFSNERRNDVSGQANKHYAVRLGTATTGCDFNYNDYYTNAGNDNSFALNNATVLPVYITNWLAGDANSYTSDPIFINPTGTAATVDLHIDPSIASIVESTGINIPAVTDDFDGQTRATLTPTDMGADAGLFTSAVCLGVPDGGTVSYIGNSTPICITGTRQLTVIGATALPGITYQWKESLVAGGPYTNVTGGSGATTNTFTTPTISQTTYYVCEVTCSTGPDAVLSAEKAVSVDNPQVLTANQVAPVCGLGPVTLTATGSAGTSISWFSSLTGGTALGNFPYGNIPVTGFNNDVVANGFGVSNTVSSGTMPDVSQPTIGIDGVGYTFIDQTYQWYTGSTLPTCFLPSGGAIPSALTSGLTYQLQSYAATNNALTIASNTYSGSVWPTTGTLTLPTPASYANLKVLYETVLNTSGPTLTATVTFTDATTQVFSGNSFVNWFTATGVAYTPSISRAQNIAPGAPGACATGPYLFELSLPLSAANYTKLVQSISFNFSAATGTTASTVDYFHALAVGGNIPPYLSSYTTPALAVTTPYYVQASIGTCNSTPRTLINAVIDVPPTLTISGNQTVCNDAVATLSVTSNIPDYDSYVWSPITNLYLDPAATSTPYTGGSATTVYLKSATSGPVVYTCTASQTSGALCSNFTSTTVTVQQAINAVISASVNPVCSGSSSVLTASVPLSGTIVLGAGATTSATYSNPFYSLWSNTHMQYLVTASELSALNITAGTMTSLGVNITAAGTLPMIELSVKVAHTTATNMSAYVSPAFTTVYTSPSLLPVVGVNTLVFSTPFNWDGISNIVIEICHGNPSSTATMSRTCLMDVTSYVSAIHTHKTVGTGGNSQCGDNATNLTTYSARPQFTFGFAAVQPSAFSWSDGSTIVGNTNPIIVNPTSSTTYTVTETISGCQKTSAPYLLNVNPLPSGPTAVVPTSTQCGVGIPTVLVSSTSGAASPQFFWYSAATAGTTLQTPPLGGGLQNYYTNDFSSGTLSNSSIGGAATISGGVLALQPTSTSTGGSITVNPSGFNSSLYQTDFDLSLIATGTTIADGFSYSFGDDAIPLSNSSIPTAERGSGSKLRIGFFTFNAANGSDGKGIYLMYGVTATTGYTSATPGVLAYSNNTSWIPTAAGTVSSHVTASINALGQLTLSVGGNTIFTDVQLPAGYLSADKSTWKHIFSSRSGGVVGGFSMDNLAIQVNTYGAGFTSFQSTIDTTTNFYVVERDAVTGCESSPRTLLVTTVTYGDPVVAHASINNVDVSSICLGGAFNLSAVQTGLQLNNYTYTWTSPSGPNSGLVGSIPGGNFGAPVSIQITPTAPGTYVYQLAYTDGNCTDFNTVTVTVNPLPVITSATATPSSFCNGGTTNLLAQSSNAVPGFGTIGTATTSIGGNDGNPYRSGNGNGNQIRTQLLYTATELAASGLSAGPITSIGFTTQSASTGTIINLEISLGSTNVSALTTTFETSPLTTVFTQASFTPLSAGLNTHVFNAGTFTWDGISNILVNVCQTNSISGTATVSAFTPGFASNTHKATTTTSCTFATGTAIANKPMVTFGGYFGTDITNTFTWVWNPGNLSGNSVTASPTATTLYTVTATNPVTGCTNTATANVTVIPLPTAPTSAGSSQCGYGIPSAIVTSTTVAVNPVFNWYSAPTGGTLLQTSTSATYLSAININTTFYVSEVGAGGCESFPRTPVVITVTQPDPVAISSPAIICVGSPITFTANQTGSTNTYVYTWSAIPAAGSGIVGSPTGSTQTVSPTVGGNYNYIVIGFDAGSNCTVVDTQAVGVFPGISGTVSATQISSCSSVTGLISANVSGAGTVVNNDFTSSVLPPNMTGAGNDFAIVGGQMRFTSNTASKNGGVLITNPTGLANNDFQIDFDMITTAGSGTPADGFSYSYGPDVVALPTGTGSTTVGTVVAPNATNPENGSGSALKLSFDAYANGANTAGIYLMYNCPVWNQTPASSGVLFNSAVTSWRATTTTGATTHVTIQINALGQVSMYLNGVQVVTNQQLPPSYLLADKSTWQHAFCARTGAEYEGHFIDNLIIQYNNFYEYSIDGGATWTTTTPIVPPGPGTYSVDARYVVLPSCTSNLGSVTINSPSFTTVSSAPSVCSYSPAMPTLSFTPAFTGATYQWESSPAGLNTWTDVSGATSATLVPTTITADTDFRCKIMCGGTPIVGSPSTPVTVLFVTPVVTGSTPASRCGTGTLNLQATGSAGSTLQWYDVPTGGTVLGTGSPFTTPTISTSTVYYVAASSGGGSTQISSNGVPTVTTSTQNTGLLFDLNVQVTLNSIQVYSTAAGTVTVTLLNSSLTTMFTSSPYPIVASNLTTPQTVPLGWSIPAGTNYRILVSNTGNALGYATGVFPAPMGNGVGTITNGATATGTTTLNYFVYNMNTSTGCESTRTPVLAAVTAGPTILVSPSSTICQGDSITLTAQSINDPNYTYTWTPGGFVGPSYKVAPSVATTYTVTGIDNSSGGNAGCQDIKTVTISVNQRPTINVLQATPAALCGGDSAQINLIATPFISPTFTGAYALSNLTGQTYTTLTGPGITVINTTAQLLTGMGSTTQDDGGVVVTLPFSFTYNGTAFNQMSMCTNGWVGAGNQGTIDALSMRTAANLFTSTIPNNTIAAWFKDMGANFPTGTGSMRHGLIGTDIYAFQWDNAVGSGFSDGSTNTISFQINIYGPASGASGRIEMIYGPQANTLATAAAIGIENATGGTNNYINALTGTGSATTTSSAWPGNGNGYRFNPLAPSTLSYSWTPAATLSNASISNPKAGPSSSTTYTVTIVEAGTGCSRVDSITITSLPLPQPKITQADTLLCFPDEILLFVTDTGLYSGGYPVGTTVDWVGIVNGLSPSVGVASSNGSQYQARVVLPNGCNAYSNIVNVITRSVTVVPVISPAACGNNSGKVIANITAGNAPFHYVWTDGVITVRDTVSSSTSDSLTNLAPGTYYLTIYDNYGLVVQSCNSGAIPLVVPGNAPLVASISASTNVSCNNAGDGSATVGTTGGSGVYTYLWSSGQSSASIFGLIGGTYTVTVSDQFGCSDTAVVVITEPAPIVIGTLPTMVTCNGGSDGTITANVSGGTTPYQIDWFDGSFVALSSGPTLTGQPAGLYFVVITDANGCFEFAQETITEPVAVVISSFTPSNGSTGTVVTINGGDFTGTTNVLFNGVSAASFTVVNSGEITAVVPSGASTGLISVVNGSCSVNSTGTFTFNSSATLNVTAIIEGYYIGGGQMTSTLLSQGVAAAANECDTITVELRDQFSPATVVASVRTVLHVDGQAAAVFPGALSGGSYYVVVLHRNALQTWSALPVTLSGNTSYNFTTANGQSYGSNMKLVDTGIWAMYSGDIEPQDEFIDVFDQSTIDNDAGVFAFGYYSTDVNGDGFVDVFDQAIVDNNATLFIFSAHP